MLFQVIRDLYKETADVSAACYDQFAKHFAAKSIQSDKTCIAMLAAEFEATVRKGSC